MHFSARKGLNSDSPYISLKFVLEGVIENKSSVVQVKAWSLQWRHNEPDGVSSHQPHDCLLNRLFRHRSNMTSKLRVTGLCAGNSPLTGEFPAQGAVMWKMFPFDDVIMALNSRQWYDDSIYWNLKVLTLEGACYIMRSRGIQVTLSYVVWVGKSNMKSFIT